MESSVNARAPLGALHGSNLEHHHFFRNERGLDSLEVGAVREKLRDLVRIVADEDLVFDDRHRSGLTSFDHFAVDGIGFSGAVLNDDKGFTGEDVRNEVFLFHIVFLSFV